MLLCTAHCAFLLCAVSVVPWYYYKVMTNVHPLCISSFGYFCMFIQTCTSTVVQLWPMKFANILLFGCAPLPLPSPPPPPVTEQLHLKYMHAEPAEQYGTHYITLNTQRHSPKRLCHTSSTTTVFLHSTCTCYL